MLQEAGAVTRVPEMRTDLGALPDVAVAVPAG